MKEGWKAKGLLKPLWTTLDPPIARQLAELSGVNEKTLYGVNTGRRTLGYDAAEKIPRALGISLYDLGAPRPRESDFALSMLGQILHELRRNPPSTDPDLLVELA